MKQQATKLLLILATICILFVSASYAGVHRVGCNLNQERHYTYRSHIHSFGGAVRDETGHRQDNLNSKRGEQSDITADVYFTCAKQFIKPHKSTNGTTTSRVYIMHMNIKNVDMVMHMDDPSKAPKKKPSSTATQKQREELNKHFTKFTAFTMSSTGQVLKVFHEKKEEAWVTAMKKSIIAQLQVKFGTTSTTTTAAAAAKKPKIIERVEKDGIGKHTAHYNTTKLDNGAKVVSKKFTDRDIETSNPGKHRALRLSSATDTLVDKNGQIKETVKHEKVILGTHHHTHAQQPIFDERNIPYSEDGSFSTGKDMWLTADESTSLTFVKDLPFTQAKQVQQMIKHKKKNNNKTYKIKADDSEEEFELFDSHADLVLDESLVHSDLSVPEETLSEMGQTIRKQVYLSAKKQGHRGLNGKRLINKLFKNPEHTIVASKLSQIAALDDDVLQALYDKFEHVHGKVDDNHDFLRIAQAIMASIPSSEKAQKMFIRTLRTKPLIHHGILRSLNIQKPSQEVVQVMSHYADQYNHESDEEDDIIAMNAYLTLADMANRVECKQTKQQIIGKIIKYLQQAPRLARKAKREELTMSEQFLAATASSNNSTTKTVIPQATRVTPTMKHFLLNIHALGNAGDAAPLRVLKVLLKRPGVPDKVRIAAADALRKRVKNDKAINKLVHELIASKRVSVPVKLAIVKAQCDREQLIGKGHSLEEFKKLMLSEDKKKHFVPRAVKAAMINYFVAQGSDKAAQMLGEIKREWAEKHMRKTNNSTGSLADTEEFEMFDSLSDEDLQHLVEMSDAEFFKKIGKAIKKAAQKVGGAVKKVGQGVKKVTKKVGEGVKKAAKAVGTAVKKAAQAVGNAAKGALDKVKKVVAEAKKIFGAASFEGNRICIPASNKPGDNMCFYDKDMINFLARFGDMSNHNFAAHFEFEKLIGSKKIHLYVGALGVAGTNFNCQDPPQEFEFVAAGRFDAKANVFSKSYNIISASIHSALKGTYDDNMFLKLLGTTIVDARILSDKVVRNLCKEATKPLANKDFNNLPKYDFTVMIGPIPLTFGFRITANARLDAVAGYCLNDLTARAGLVPSVSVGVAGSAAIGIVIARAGIEVEVSLNYGLFPNVNLRGLQCKLCANLDNKLQPMKVKISAFAEINIFVLKGRTGFKIFEWGQPAQQSTLFQKCLDLPKLFKKK